MLTKFFLVLILGCLAFISTATREITHSLAANQPNHRTISEIIVSVTPGKPLPLFDSSQPAEMVSARREDDHYLLVVSVNVARPGVRRHREETAVLSAKEWQSLVQIVGDENLLEWQPEESSRQALDYGERGFAINGEEKNRQKWHNPLVNDGPPSALMKRMASLAKQKVLGLPLFYLAR